VTASIGVACSPGAACRPDDLLHQAGVALATAKRRGKGLWEIYPLAQRHDRRVTERLRLRTELHQAVAGGELEVRYQPVVDLGTGRIAGVEALVRWQHPTRGLLGPEAFIGLAEDTGVIHGIGEHVLREACTAVRRWQLGYPSTDPAREPLSVGVNLSVRQLAEPGLVDTVRAALLDSGLPPASLTLEITETVLAHDLDQAARTVSALRSLGVRIAIDDFGTGYSSLSYLERLDVDVLKVDRSFIDRVGAGRPPSALLRAVVGLGNELGLEVVAEGVEQEGQVHALAELGCGLAQGYHFARPLDELDVALLLERGRSGVAHFAEAVGQVRP